MVAIEILTFGVLAVLGLLTLKKITKDKRSIADIYDDYGDIVIVFGILILISFIILANVFGWV